MDIAELNAIYSGYSLAVEGADTIDTDAAGTIQEITYTLSYTDPDDNTTTEVMSVTRTSVIPQANYEVNGV